MLYLKELKLIFDKIRSQLLQEQHFCNHHAMKIESIFLIQQSSSILVDNRSHFREN